MTKQTEDDENPKEASSLQNDEKINTSLPSYPAPNKGPKLSLKDYYLSEYDDQEEPVSSPHEKNTNLFLSPELAKSWRAFLTIFASFLGLVIIAASLVYLWVSDRTGDEETKAAKSVADIAMSLTYAQLKNIHPQNQHWSHPEFIKNNLTPILAPNYLSLAEVDSHGQFVNCPYMLRIHSSSDLSQFLVIAQPCPSLLQWLIPKASIIVDSRVMEMRKIVDLKALNRLIVNSNNLDELSAHEISRLVSQGELIPLSSLVNKAENQGLALPKALGLIRPGAENRLYNAPRYYLLGERILNHALDLVDKFAGNKEIDLLQQELNMLVHFPDLVLYTPGGIQHALKAQKALTALMPNDTFLIAYLHLNSHGKITNTHLLMDDSQSDLAIAETRSPSNGSLNSFHMVDELETEPELSLKEVETDQSSAGPIQEIDTANPLYFQLSSIASSRYTALKPISDEIVSLLKRQTLSTQPDFTSRLIKLQQKYMDADREEQNKIFKKLHTITQDHQFLPAAKFLDFIQATGLKTLFQEYLLSQKKKSKENQVSDEQIDQQLQNIQASTTWQELEQHTAQLNQFLQFDHFYEEGRLISFQNSARSIVTQKLNQFILSSTEALPANAFNPEYLQTLINIIKAVWITDPDMHDFYIAEFELREPIRESH